MKYDFLIVGSGLFGSVFAFEAKKRGKRCLVLDRRFQTGGNLYCKNRDNIWVHEYGAHIFHTNQKAVWDYVNELVPFNNYINSPIANYKGKLYNLPFNMNTFYQMWGTKTPEEVEAKLKKEKSAFKGEIKNLEDQAISLVGKDIYEKLIKGYTEKQWGKSCTELPSFIIKRLPVRLRYDNNYFNDNYQGIPVGGYNPLIKKLLEGTEVRLGVDFNEDFKVRKQLMDMANKVIYTGTLDSYFDYSLGHLDYRSEKFELKKIDKQNFQGVSVMNFTEREIPYTRIIEHKHFETTATHYNDPVTWISYEMPYDYKKTGEPYYPVNDQRNTELYSKYVKLAKNEDKLIIGGRLAEYSYFDMDKTIMRALSLVDQVL